MRTDAFCQNEKNWLDFEKENIKKQPRPSLQFFKFQFLAVKLGFTLTDKGVLMLQPWTPPLSPFVSRESKAPVDFNVVLIYAHVKLLKVDRNERIKEPLSRIRQVV